MPKLNTSAKAAPAKTPTKAQVSSAKVLTMSGLSEEVDELVGLLDWAKEQAAHPNHARIADLNTLIKDEGDAHLGEDQIGNFVGAESSDYIEVGAIPTTREITDMKAVRKLLGDEVFFANATIPLGKLDKLLAADALAKVVTSTRGGNRRVTRKTPKD